jgi:lysyl endopeptidase
MDRLLLPRQRYTGRLLLVMGFGLFLGSGAAGWAAKPPVNDDGAAEAFGVRGPSLDKVLKPVRPLPSEEMGLALGTVPGVRLDAIDTDAVLREDEARRARTKVVRFGVGRDVQVGVRDGKWYDLANGQRLWVAEVASTDAIGLRLHFKDVRLPDGAELAIYAPAASDPARGIVKSGASQFDPDRYVEFYGSANPVAKRGDFWTGTLFGERARIEYLAPADAAAEELPFAVDRLQHTYLDPVAQLAKGFAKAPAGPCHNDVACFPEWEEVSRAVSGVGFIGSDQLFCTGQLLNVSGKADFTPYWLTAHHCMDSQFEAESVEFFWLYQKATCGGMAPSLASVPRSQRATLLSTNHQSDYTLLLIEGAVPAGELFWAGWTSKEPGNGADAVAIHHPNGDHKRISFGFKDVVNECDAIQDPAFVGVKKVRTTWTNAVTEPGSSGSGIFRADTGQLYGQLLGGPSFCGIQPDGLFDCYGSFAVTFPRIKNLLKAGSDDKSEQNDACPRARLVKSGNFGNRIVKILDEDWYKISVPAHRTVIVDASFANGNGDVDLQMFASCAGGDPLSASEGTGDSESVGASNVGNKPAFVWVRVFLADDTRNNYDLSVHFE